MVYILHFDGKANFMDAWLVRILLMSKAVIFVGSFSDAAFSEKISLAKDSPVDVEASMFLADEYLLYVLPDD